LGRITTRAFLASAALLYAAVSASQSTNWQALDVAPQVGLQIRTTTDGYLCVADFDADGRADVLLSRHGDEPWPLMRQRTDGTFFQQQTIGPKNDRHSCTVGDFASVTPTGFGPPDGLLDFYITTGACQGNCTKEYPNYLHIQRLDGTFQDAAAAFDVRDPHGRGRKAATLDANLDGRDDLFFTNQISDLYPDTGNRLFLNLAPGLAEWADPAVRQTLETVCARALDFNDDGRTDLVVCASDRHLFLANTPLGFVDVRAALGLPTSPVYRDVAVVDFNGDGHSDLVAIERTKLTVRLWRATAPNWGAISYTFNVTQGRGLAVGNLFGSGVNKDIYVLDGWASGTLQKPDWILRWTGTPTALAFQAYQVPSPPLTMTSNPRDGEGDSVQMVPDWAGTGRDLALVSNGLWQPGYYQAIVMWQVDGAPNVVGLTQAAAVNVITNAGLVLGSVTTQSSSTVPAGSVISQYPAAGTSIASGSPVNLVISAGALSAVVPNVVNLTQALAASVISGAGLTMGAVIQQASTTVPSGRVISQSPIAGTSVANGSAVNLVVSTGAPTAVVPNVVGMTQAAATAAISDAGLAVGSVTQQSHASVPAGSVISQNPAGGSTLAPGATVSLSVSTGPATVTVPDVVGLAQAAAATAISSAGLSVGGVSQQASDTVAAGNVISQNPAAGATVAEGSGVAIVVSLGKADPVVPNVVGLAQSAATAAITSAGLVVGTVTSQASTTVAAGDVISQDPTAGTSAPEGSSVSLVVSSGPPVVTVPDVVGMTQAAATSAITAAELVAGAVTQESSEDVPAGAVISQSPTGGTSAATGSAVNLVVSAGPAPVSVPDVVGLAEEAAAAAIVGAELAVGTVTPQSSTSVPTGNVISQDPPAGASVAKGSAVSLAVSTGPANVSVPDVVGLTQTAASSAIAGAGLVVGSVTPQSSDTVPAGNVISQSPEPGTTAVEGSAVDFAVSTGPEPVAVPDVVGLTQSEAVTAIANAGLVVGTISEQSSQTVPAGAVISQNPAPGASAAPGSAVNLAVSTGVLQVTVPNVVGLSQSAALAAIAGAGLVSGAVTQQSSDTVPAGDVISQSPDAGTTVVEGSAVDFAVSTGPEPVAVPDVVGLTQSEAATTIANAGLVVGTISEQSSETVPAGTVMSQDPPSGASVVPGFAVNFTVSTGVTHVTVPNVVGLSQNAALAAIAGAGLVSGPVTQQSSDTVPAGEVISQSPDAGTTVVEGSAVGFAVSTGPEPVAVPDVVGLTQAEAATAIANAGLVVGTVSEQSSATVAAGTVISQNPLSGVSVAPGSAVSFTVSTGIAQATVPDVVGLSQAAAATAIWNAGLAIGSETQQTSETVPAGHVVSQTPASGTSVDEGSGVDLVVSSGAPQVTVPNVVGLTQAAAGAAIVNAGLVVGTVTQQSSTTVAAGSVISQNPTTGVEVDSGSAVDLVASSGTPQVTVPNVVGATQAAATTAITNAGLVVGTVTQQSSTTVAAGSVISQSPTAGVDVDSGSAVNLVVSSGAPQTTVPNVVGATQSAATTTITNAGLVVGTVTQQSSTTVAAGSVISQNPTAGVDVDSGSAVSLVVSSGTPQVTVPNVVGVTQAAAGAAIASAGLVVGTVTLQSSTTVAAGDVISQNPTAGVDVASGSAVNLVISSGTPQVTVPNVVGLTQTAATTAITNAGLVVGTVTQQSSTTVAAGSVISQGPTAGNSVASGSAVNLVVSSGAPASASGATSPTSLAFGNWMLNVAAPGRAVTLTNTGTIALPISSTSLSGSNSGQFSRSTNCPSQLAVGGSCTVTVVFRPTSAGNKSANLVIALGGGAGNKTVALTGTGVNYSFTLSPTSLSFGSLARGNTSAAKNVTVKNTSSTTLPLASVNLAGSNPGQFTMTNNCPSQLSAGASCTVAVRFKPTSTGGKSATLVVTPGNGVAAKSASLSGTGT